MYSNNIERPRRIARFSSESHLFISAQKIINSAQIEQDQQFFLSQEFILSQLIKCKNFIPALLSFFDIIGHVSLRIKSTGKNYHQSRHIISKEITNAKEIKQDF